MTNIDNMIENESKKKYYENEITMLTIINIIIIIYLIITLNYSCCNETQIKLDNIINVMITVFVTIYLASSVVISWSISGNTAYMKDYEDKLTNTKTAYSIIFGMSIPIYIILIFFVICLYSF